MRLIENETKSFVKNINTNINEAEESYKNLYDYLAAVDGDDIGDETYDMLVYCDIMEEENDAYDKFVNELFRRTEYKGDGIADFTKLFENKIDKLAEIFDFWSDDEDDQLEDFICRALPSLISGGYSDETYKEMYDLLVN